MPDPVPFPQRIENLERHAHRLQASGGGGTFDGFEARVAKLEAAVEHMQSDIREIKDDLREIRRDARSDFRQLFGAIIVVAIGLAGLMAKGFHWY